MQLRSKELITLIGKGFVGHVYGVIEAGCRYRYGGNELSRYHYGRTSQILTTKESASLYAFSAGSQLQRQYCCQAGTAAQ